MGGITQSFIKPAYNELYVQVGEKETGKSFGERSSLVNISLGLSALISGILIEFFGYIPIFIVWGITEIFYGIYIYYNL